MANYLQTKAGESSAENLLSTKRRQLPQIPITCRLTDPENQKKDQKNQRNMD
jgi:hypothetical protein